MRGLTLTQQEQVRLQVLNRVVVGRSRRGKQQQMGKIVSAIVLPEAWMARVLAQTILPICSWPSLMSH